jgi:hypothetical protein
MIVSHHFTKKSIDTTTTTTLGVRFYKFSSDDPPTSCNVCVIADAKVCAIKAIHQTSLVELVLQLGTQLSTILAAGLVIIIAI